MYLCLFFLWLIEWILVVVVVWVKWQRWLSLSDGWYFDVGGYGHGGGLNEW